VVYNRDVHGGANKRRGRFSVFITAAQWQGVSLFLLPSQCCNGQFLTAMDIYGL
jgi:hypothetical protein